MLYLFKLLTFQCFTVYLGGAQQMFYLLIRSNSQILATYDFFAGIKQFHGATIHLVGTT